MLKRLPRIIRSLRPGLVCLLGDTLTVGKLEGLLSEWRMPNKRHLECLTWAV